MPNASNACSGFNDASGWTFFNLNVIHDKHKDDRSNSKILTSEQPHLQRTKLCEMNDNELDPNYITKREQLKELVTSIISPKIVQAKPLNGEKFVLFLEQVPCLTFFIQSNIRNIYIYIMIKSLNIYRTVCLC